MQGTMKFVFGLALAAAAGGCGPSIAKIAPDNPMANARIQVVEFDISEADVTSYDGDVRGFGMRVAEDIARALREAGIQAEASPRAATNRGDVIVQGRVVRVDGGSRALRYIVGFGAGATKFAAEGDVTKNGQAVGKFVDERRSGFGIFGGDSEALLDRCVESVSYDIATMITTGEYSTEY